MMTPGNGVAREERFAEKGPSSSIGLHNRGAGEESGIFGVGRGIIRRGSRCNDDGEGTAVKSKRGTASAGRGSELEARICAPPVSIAPRRLVSRRSALVLAVSRARSLERCIG